MMHFIKFDLQNHLANRKPLPLRAWSHFEPTREHPNNLVLLVCPSGHSTRILSSLSRIDKTGHLSPSFKCPDCNFSAQITLEDWKEKRPLFCIIREKRVMIKGRWTWIPTDPSYLHASEIANARFLYALSDPEQMTRILFCAPVIGYHVQDEHGEKLSA